jgi:hypothetical protein
LIKRARGRHKLTRVPEFTAFALLGFHQGLRPLKGAEQGDKKMADNLVRLGLALSVIMLITLSLYAVNVPRAVAIEPGHGIALRK